MTDEDEKLRPGQPPLEAAAPVQEHGRNGVENDDDNGYALTDEDISRIVGFLHEHNIDAVRASMQDFSEADTAELLSKVSSEDRENLISLYGDSFDPYAYSELDPELRSEALESMPPAKVARIVDELDSDDALDLIINLDEDFQKEVIRQLSSKTRLALEEGLNFPEDSAGRLMQREFVAIPQFWTVGKTIDYLRAAAAELPDEFFDIFVITPTHHVVGAIPLSRLIRSQRPEKIENLSLEETMPIPATMDQEEVAHIFRREDLVSAPVVDENGRLIGVITIDDVLDVIDEEAQEDIMLLAGVEQGDLYRAVLSTAGSRSRWLAVNLLTAVVAACVISLFAPSIEKIVALAILMPIVASMGGNAGTQALTVAVRAIAARQLSSANAWRTISKEILVGTVNGFIFACVIGVVAGLWFQNPMLGGVIAAAMIINLTVAGLGGAAIPIILNKYGADPAISSSVFLTTLTDVIGFLAFLGLATLFLV